MSGSKETPRQKMVGLMYLVLMALLALNVTKEVLNAFVAIEENVQKGSLTQLERGESSKADLEEAKNDISPEKVQKVKYFLTIVDMIDKVTAARIKEIDDIKISILKKSGEQVAAFASLTSLQQEILSARATNVTHIKNYHQMVIF